MTIQAVSTTLRLLLVEDSMRDAMLAREWLREVISDSQLYSVHVQTLADALARVAAERWDCVLLDLDLPDGSGGVHNVQRVHAAAPDVAIVVVSGNNDERIALEALRWGAQEYVIKGQFDGHSLLRVIQHALERHRVVTELNRQREHNYFRASHDSLTGLANRSLFLERASEAIAGAERGDEKMALCFFDLDGFKPINDQRGHSFGDALLRAVANVLRDQVRESDTVARMGGDEFVAMLTPLRSIAEARQVATRIVQGIQAITTVQGQHVNVGVSAGLAMFPHDGADLESLMVRADVAMYAAKRHQGGGLYLSEGAEPAETAGNASSAVTMPGLTLLFQPWLNLRSGGYGGVAVLGQSSDPQSAASGHRDSTDAAHELDRADIRILERAASQWLAWRRQGIAPERMAIHLSLSALAEPAWVTRWRDVLEHLGVPMSLWQVEVAEHVFKEAKGGAVRANLDALHEWGVRIVVDRFGQEEASLTLLARLPIHGVKLDRSLLHGLRDGNQEMHALVAAILSVAHARGLDVMAMGVENEDDLRNCASLSIPYAQGFWFSEPLPAKRLTALLLDRVLDRTVLEGAAQDGALADRDATS
ncbi:putative bifunctional diguanylate cyclase/phosphodiesterase [Dyella koreensis]|uniref:Diguanylate cyclase n=1 Tax=Dyella koreensis TaxID=311235 RepID=A0ABW8K5L2_9GAMM